MNGVQLTPRPFVASHYYVDVAEAYKTNILRIELQTEDKLLKLDLGYGIGPSVIRYILLRSSGCKHLRMGILLGSGQIIPLLDAVSTSSYGSGESTYYPFKARVKYLTPIPQNTYTAHFEYFDHTLGRDSTWTLLQNVTVVPGDGIVINTESMQSGLYDFRLKLFDANQNLIPIGRGFASEEDDWYYGHVNVHLGNGFTVTPHQDMDYALLSPKIQQVPDRWGNILHQKDARDFYTNKTFNYENRLLTLDEPEINVLSEQGALQENVRTLTCYGHDEVGNTVVRVDANQHTTAHFHNACHEVVATVLADGSFQRFIMDGLGREAAIIDPLQHVKRHRFNKKDVMIQRSVPGQKPTLYVPNERLDRISETNGEGERTRFDSDAQHNTIRTILPMGQVWDAKFDRNNQIIYQDYHLEKFLQLFWTRDYFGHIQQYTDFSGAIYICDTDEAKRPTKIEQTLGTGDHGKHYSSSGIPVTVPAKYIKYANNEAGYNEVIIDIGCNTRTLLHLNPMGRRIAERFFAFDGIEHQCTFVDLNSRNWVVKIWDIRIQGIYSYDAVGNRRRTQVAYAWDDNNGLIFDTSYDNWYTYTAADLMRIVQGKLRKLNEETGIIEIIPNQGVVLEHDKAHRRCFESSLDESGHEVTKKVDYYDSDLVKEITTHLGDNSVTHELMDYDNASRRRKYQKTSTHLDDQTQNYVEIDDYNGNGWHTSHEHFEKFVRTKIFFIDQDNLGNPHLQIVDTKMMDKDGFLESSITDTYKMTYLGFEQLQLANCSGSRVASGATETPVTSVDVTFDANGGTRSIEGATTEGNRAFMRNSEQAIVYAEAGVNLRKDHVPHRAGLLRCYNQVDTEGHVLGQVGNIPMEIMTAGPEAKPSYVNFDFNYQSVSRNFPSSAPGFYWAQAGETFYSISQKFCKGDGSFASLIADANGLTEKDAVPLNRSLNIPELVLMNVHNWAGMYPRYDESKIIGSYYPYLPVPILRQPQNSHHFLEIFIEIFVEVLLMSFQPELAPIFGNLLKGTMLPSLISFASNALAGMVLGAGVDILQQITAIGFGDQKRFSTNHLLKAVINQAELAGVAGALDIKAMGLRQGLNLGETLGKTAKLIVITQLVRLATGQQKHLNWKDILATTLMSAGNIGINESLAGIAYGPMKELAADILRAAVAQATNKALYNQQIDFEVFAATALGTFAGTMASNQLRFGDYRRDEATAKRIKRNFKAYAGSLMEEAAEKMMYGTLNYEYAQANYEYVVNEEVTRWQATVRPAEMKAAASTNAYTAQNQASLFSRTSQQVRTAKSVGYHQRKKLHQEVDHHATVQNYKKVRAANSAAHSDRWLDKAKREFDHLRDEMHVGLMNAVKESAIDAWAAVQFISGMAMETAYDLGHPEQAKQDLTRLERGLSHYWNSWVANAEAVIQDPMDALRSDVATAKASAMHFAHERLSDEVTTTTKFVGSLFGGMIGAELGSVARLGSGIVVKGAKTLENSALRSRVLSNIADTRAGSKASFYKIHTLAVKARSLNVSTGLDEATFWSGRGNRELAEDFALHSNRLTLEMTPGGQYLDSLNLFDKYPGNQAIVPWERLSERFALGASGRVSAFVEGARVGSVFSRIEYPILVKNPNIEEIVYSPEYANRFTPK